MTQFESAFGKDIIKIKSEVLCWGMRISPKAFDEVIKLYPLISTEKFVHAAHFALDGNAVVDPCVSERYSLKSPYELKVENGKFVLYKEEKPQCYVEVIQAPHWY